MKMASGQAAVVALSAVLSLMAATTAMAAVVRVEPPAASLLYAMAQAQAGDRIVLGKGVYRVNLVVDKPLRLSGEPGAVLDGGGQDDVIRVRAADVVIEGLTIRNSGYDLTPMNAGVFVERTAARTHILNNRLEANAFGVWANACPDLRVENNRISGRVEVRSQDRGNGVNLFNVTGTTVAGNEIWEARDGIYIDTSNYNVLRDNHIHDLRYGIHYMYSYHNTVSGNYTHDTRTGYALMQSKYLTVTNNRSENDDNYGILMNYILYSTLQGNVIDRVQNGASRPGAANSAHIIGAEGKAIFIYNSLFNEITGNTFSNSGIGIHLTAGSEDNTIYGNRFIANQTQVKYVANRTQDWSKDGRGNYWSDYLGWDRNADGIGDIPYEPNDGVDKLLWKYPQAKVLMNSPAIETLRWVQAQFPVLRPQGVRDSHPMMQAGEATL